MTNFRLRIFKPHKLPFDQRIELVLFIFPSNRYGQILGSIDRQGLVKERAIQSVTFSAALPFIVAVGSAGWILVRLLHNVLTGADFEQDEE